MLIPCQNQLFGLLSNEPCFCSCPPARPWLGSFITHTVTTPSLGRAQNARAANREEGRWGAPGSGGEGRAGIAPFCRCPYCVSDVMPEEAAALREVRPHRALGRNGSCPWWLSLRHWLTLQGGTCIHFPSVSVPVTCRHSHPNWYKSIHSMQLNILVNLVKH